MYNCLSGDVYSCIHVFIKLEVTVSLSRVCSACTPNVLRRHNQTAHEAQHHLFTWHVINIMTERRHVKNKCEKDCCSTETSSTRDTDLIPKTRS